MPLIFWILVQRDTKIGLMKYIPVYGSLAYISWFSDFDTYTCFCLKWPVEVLHEHVCECSKVTCRNRAIFYSRREAGTSVSFGRISSLESLSTLILASHLCWCIGQWGDQWTGLLYLSNPWWTSGSSLKPQNTAHTYFTDVGTAYVLMVLVFYRSLFHSRIPHALSVWL